MRLSVANHCSPKFTFIFLALIGLLIACSAEEPPECDIEEGDEIACTCDDGTSGLLVCNDEGLADCICHSGADAGGTDAGGDDAGVGDAAG